MANFEYVIENLRAESDSTVELGNSFERLMKNFLLTAPVYNFTDVCLWSEFAQRDQFGGHDIGIDIVAIDRHNDYWAVQCKFYQPDIRIDKPAVRRLEPRLHRRRSARSFRSTPLDFDHQPLER